MKRALLLMTLFAGSSMAQEKLITLRLSQPLELYGGVSAGYFYTTNPHNDAFQLTNAIVGLRGEAGNSIKMGFDLAFGQSFIGTIDSPLEGSSAETDTFGVVWGYVTLKPLNGVSVDAGILTTNIGFEIADTYSNPNVLFGSVWWAQPFRYPGARITYDAMEGISLYAEYNKEYGGDNFAVGSLGNVGNISYAITYFDYNDTDTSGTNKNLIDLVLSASLGPTTLGLNLDYQWLDDSQKTSGQDDSAYGIALYFIPTFGNLSVPIRLEYFNSGTSGIYLDEEGYTATVTPTLRPSENTFIRLDVSFISTENDVFGSEDDKTTASLELGFTF